MVRIREEYSSIYANQETPEADERKLDHLGEYLLDRGNQIPVAGWSELWGKV